ncbi:MAG TPA: MG2 domain-containing protein, partial [Candidatus Wallbacteria bacterium]|nr:MG2 domain-containing protein [Candidatus Wallbacteria bacterium]
MKILAGLLILSLTVILAPAVLIAAEPPESSADLWKKVEEAQNNGLPQTAVDNLKKIYEIALPAKKYGEALKAICLQIVFESNIKGNKAEEKITRLTDEIVKADEQMKPLMNIVLAQWYWHFFANNRWRFMNRTQTAGLSEKDFTTWDLPKLFNHISEIHQQILKNEDKLKLMNISDFSDVLEMGNIPVSIQPTVFDFASNKALEFYESGEQAAAAPQDAFDISVSSDAFAEAQKFLQYKPDTTDTKSPKLIALLIYQKLLLFHQTDGDKSAYVDIDIRRLNYVKNVASGENKPETFVKRMKEIASEYAKLEVSTLAKYHWAQQIYENGEYVEALKLAQEGEKAFPNSAGSLNCRMLSQQILLKTLSIQAERAVPAGQKSKISLKYKNIETITFRAMRDDWKSYFNDKGGFFPNITDEQKRALLNKKPEAEWTNALTPTADYKEKQAVIEVPELKHGFYRIFASHKKDFSEADNRVDVCFLWVSDISIVIREREKNIEGFVLDSMSGAPVKGAKLKVYAFHEEYRQNDYLRKCEIITTGTSDENGCFSINASRRDNYYGMMIYASDNKNSEFFDTQEIYPGDIGSESEYTETMFFTDRSIYRPGQQINFKGICMKINRETNKYEVIPNHGLSVYFRDPNGQEITRVKLTTNDFGSFAGTFNAPTDRATGAMTIGTDGPSGSAQIRVEEYKRPKFTVELKIPDEGFKLDANVNITGEAMAYTGAAIDGALVKWRVTRTPKMPYWWDFYCYGAMPSSEQEIANGKAKTDANGKFTITFTAKADPSIPKANDPTFNFQIFADVTDTAGETRSDQKAVRLGYTAMEAKLSAEKWQNTDKAVAVSVDTTTLDGKPIPAEGVVEIFELSQPAKPVKA